MFSSWVELLFISEPIPFFCDSDVCEGFLWHNSGVTGKFKAAIICKEWDSSVK